VYDEIRKEYIKEKTIRISLENIEIMITTSFEKDDLNQMIEKADKLVEKYNKQKKENQKNDIR